MHRHRLWQYSEISDRIGAPSGLPFGIVGPGRIEEFNPRTILQGQSEPEKPG